METANTVKLNKIRRQRNRQQMKEQGKNTPDQTNEQETGSLPEKQFRATTEKMIQNLRKEWRKYKKYLRRT